MDEKQDSLVEHRPIDRRTIFIIIGTIVLSFIGFYVIDNFDYLVAGQRPADQWNRIDTYIVERSCLDQAKKVAVSEGYSDVFVLSCTCINVQSEILKTFDCNVNTADIVHPARKVLVHCYRASSQCTVASDKGLQTYNFTDLEQYLVQ